MAYQNGVRTPAQAETRPSDVLRRMQTFLGVVKETIEQENVHRARFPNFVLTQDIKEKLAQVKTLVAEKDFKGALQMLNNVEGHFQNKQARYARGFVDIFGTAIDKLEHGTCHVEVIGPLNRMLREYRDYVEQPRFELEEASELCWNIQTALDTAWDRSAELMARDNAAKEQQRRNVIISKRQKQEAETQAGIERHKTRVAERQGAEVTSTLTQMERILAEIDIVA